MRKPGEVDVVFVAITLADGSLSVMQFVVAEYGNAGKARWTRQATDAAIQSEIDRTALPAKAVSWRRIQRGDLPESRAFRDAWTDTGRAVDHDLPKVRQIHLGRLRQQRDSELAKLDAETMKALGKGDNKKRDEVEAAKQALRDMPQRVGPLLEAAETVEAIAGIGWGA